MRIAIDFDGVIHDPNNRLPGYKLGQPIEGAIQALQRLHSRGDIIVIHSVWASTEQRCQAIAKWCTYFNIPYDFITNQKPEADLYVDNRGYRFDNWGDTLDFIDNV